MFVAENEPVSLTDSLICFDTGEIANIDDVAGCGKVLVEYASTVALREA